MISMFYVFAVIIAGLLAANIFGLLSLDMLFFLLFLLSIAVFVYIKRKKVKRQGILIIHRTKRGIDIIDNIAKKHPRFWNALAVIGIFIAVPAMLIGSYYLINQAYQIYIGESMVGGVGLLLPGPAPTPQTLPGLFIVPWWIWVIGIAVVMFPHEISHGIVCRLEKIRIQSVGWLLLLFLPGAFVEPDEKQLQKAPRSTKLKVYAAGSFANLVVALVLVIILSAWFALAFTQTGVAFAIVKDSPAHKANLTGSIVEFNGVQIASHEDLSAEIAKYESGDVVTVKTVEIKDAIPTFRIGGDSRFLGVFDGGVAVITGEKTNTFEITLGEHPDKPGVAYLGVANPAPAGRFAGDSLLFLYIILFWSFLFSFGIGMVNLLPIKPLDGGLLFEELTGALTKNNRLIVQVVTTGMILILLFNLFGPAFV